MNIIQRSFLFFIPILFPFTIFAQNAKIDSLINVLKSAKEDTNKVNASNDLGWKYIMKGKNDEAAKYINTALELGKKLNFKNGTAISYHELGLLYKRESNYEKSLENENASLKIMEELGNKNGIANSYNSIGTVYLNQGFYEKALNIILKGLKIRESTGDKSGMAACYNNIALVFGRQRNVAKQLENQKKAVQLMEEAGDKQGTAVAYSNIGIIYKGQHDFEKALENYSKALKISESLGDKGGIAGCLTNIGIVYVMQNNLTEASKNYLQALDICRETGDKNMLARVLGNFSMVQLKQGKPDDALRSLNESLEIFKKIGDKSGLQEVYGSMAEVAEKKGDYKNAYAYHKLYADLKDTLFNETSAKNMAEMNSKFESEKKDKELITKDAQIVKQQAESDKQQTQRNALILGLLLMLIFALFIFRSYKQKQRANSELASKNQLIEQQKKEVDFQKELVDQKNKEMMDSIHYAQRIQQALLANELLLKNNLPDHFILYQPKDIVSGDFYWANAADGKFLLCNADCTGHGVPGAFMSLLSISFLNEAVIGQKLSAPNEILNYTRTQIIHHLANDGSAEGGKDGMDCSLISFDLKNKQFTYSSANNPIWIVRQAADGQTGKQILELTPDKMPVGKHDKDTVSFTQHTIDLQKGDVVYMLTDGIADQFGGPKGKKFMYRQLKDLLVSVSGLPMQDQKEKIRTSLNDWRGNMEQIDDVCMIGVRI